MNTNFLNSVTNFLKKRSFELAGLILISIGILLSFSFITYSPNDPTLIYGDKEKHYKQHLRALWRLNFRFFYYKALV